MNHRLGAADDEGLVAFEEIGDDLDKGFGPLGADRMACVIDEDEVAVRDQLLVEMPHLGRDHPVMRAVNTRSASCLHKVISLQETTSLELY